MCLHARAPAQTGLIHKYTRSSSSSGANTREVRKGPRAELEPNHTHFIFADAGVEATGQFGKEIDMRVQLENYLVEHTSKASM